MTFHATFCVSTISLITLIEGILYSYRIASWASPCPDAPLDDLLIPYSAAFSSNSSLPPVVGKSLCRIPLCLYLWILLPLGHPTALKHLILHDVSSFMCANSLLPRRIGKLATQFPDLDHIANTTPDLDLTATQRASRISQQLYYFWLRYPNQQALYVAHANTTPDLDFTSTQRASRMSQQLYYFWLWYPNQQALYVAHGLQ